MTSPKSLGVSITGLIFCIAKSITGGAAGSASSESSPFGTLPAVELSSAVPIVPAASPLSSSGVLSISNAETSTPSVSITIPISATLIISAAVTLGRTSSSI